MTGAIDRLRWILLRRRHLAAMLTGFWASPRSYASADCVFAPYNRIYQNAQLHNIRLDVMSYIAEASRVGFSDIGAYTSIGPRVMLGGLGKHPVDRLSTHPAFYSSRLQAGTSFTEDDLVDELPRVTVGSDVWIGAGSIVLDGLKLADGAIVGAGAVVTKDVPPYAVVGGVPARIIRFRFDEATIEALLAWRWWELDHAQLAAVAHRFRGRHWTPQTVREAREEAAAPQARSPLRLAEAMS